MGAIGEAAAEAPTCPGVYFFLDHDGRLLYVGKAGNVRRRLQQHAKAARERTTPRDARRDDLVTAVRWEECADEPAAAAREADLIVTFRPLLNGSLATDGRWVYLSTVAASPPPSLTFRFTATADWDADRVYGCFPHLGVGVSSTRGIACSEGYTAFLRLLWAACETDDGARHPRPIAGPSPPTQVSLPFAAELGPSVHRLLSGTSARLLDDLVARAERVRPAFMLPALRRDREAAHAFFEHGPRALRQLRLAHHRPPGPLSRADFASLFAAELRTVIGEVEVPAVADDQAAALLGQRHARSRATRSAM